MLELISRCGLARLPSILNLYSKARVVQGRTKMYLVV